MSKEEIIKRVSVLLFRKVKESHRRNRHPSDLADLFKESNFSVHKFELLSSPRGFHLSQPTVMFSLDRQRQPPKKLNPRAINDFLSHVFESLPLALECILIAFIYLERISAVCELRHHNWRPLTFGAILIASKFFEDISFWNVDFVSVAQIYPLSQINKLESLLLGVLNYDTMVSRHLYASTLRRVTEGQDNPTPKKMLSKSKSGFLQTEVVEQSKVLRTQESQFLCRQGSLFN